MASISSKRALKYSSTTSSEPRLDTRGDSVAWMNDLENDRKYRMWPRSVHGLMQMIYPGQVSLILLFYY
jgi:hypothetical protein